MGERHRWQGRVLLFWKEAADLEPAGRPRPCGKSSDAELVSRGREEGQHPHPLISPTGLIWGQIGGGADRNCAALPNGASLGLPGAVRTCGTCPVWVLSQDFPAGSSPPPGRFGQPKRKGSRRCRFKLNQQVFCTFGLFHVL